MRMIGQIDNDKRAATFSDYLFLQGIENDVEYEREGLYSLWIRDEDHITLATDLLKRFLANPAAPEFKNVAEAARRKLQAQLADEEAARERIIDGRQALAESAAGHNPYLTVLLMVVSIGVFSLASLGDQSVLEKSLKISTQSRQLPEVCAGEIWRLVTPIFLHGGWLHIIFNMLWLKDLGAMIEGRQGTRYFGLLVLVTAMGSNLGQNFLGGPNFGGMSGVVYGLLGYAWMKGKFDPHSDIALHPDVVVMMLIWLVICGVGLIPHVANTAHAVGLLIGAAWGYLSARAAVNAR